MQLSFLNRIESWQLMLILFVLMIMSICIGLRLGRKYHSKSIIEFPVIAGLFALLGLMLAFSFSLSLTNYNNRIEIIIEESNKIGTTILRTNLYREPDRKLLREDLKKYVDARVNYYTMGTDEEKVLQAQRLSTTLQQQLFSKVSELSKDPVYNVASMQMIPALNSMIDITNTRFYANYVHLPDVIIYLLIILSCVCSFYMGFVSVKKEKFDWPLAGGACLLIAVVFSVNLDLDRPRQGFIRLDHINHSIVDLKQMFSEEETSKKINQ
jgi:hypothetical protein